MSRVTVIGAGAWGTALACMFARNGHATILWGRDKKSLQKIARTGENKPYLPTIKLPTELCFETDMAAAARSAEILLLVTPAQTIAEMADKLSGHLAKSTPVVLCAKGINRESGKLPAEISKATLSENPLAVLSGPSFASDVAKGLPTAVTLAASRLETATSLCETLSSTNFRLYASDDMKGVELGGALKNVIALAVGVCRGMKLGASAEAALIARGFAELNRLALALGAQPATLMGLSGLGDLVLTCSSAQSRNFAYGMALGAADTSSKLPSGLKLAEGALTAPIAAKIAREKNVDAPIISTVAQLIDGEITAKSAVNALLTRRLKKESE